MEKIAIPKNLFNEIYNSYDLRCYCGDKRSRFSLPGKLNSVKPGDEVAFFTPGVAAVHREIYATIIHADPIVIDVTGIRPDSRELHEIFYKIKEAAAQVPLDIVTE